MHRRGCFVGETRRRLLMMMERQEEQITTTAQDVAVGAKELGGEGIRPYWLTLNMSIQK